MNMPAYSAHRRVSMRSGDESGDLILLQRGTRIWVAEGRAAIRRDGLLVRRIRIGKARKPLAVCRAYVRTNGYRSGNSIASKARKRSGANRLP